MNHGSMGIIVYDTAFTAKLILVALNPRFKMFPNVTYLRPYTVYSRIDKRSCMHPFFKKKTVVYASNVLSADTDHMLIITEPRELLSSLIFQGGELYLIGGFPIIKGAIPN